MTQTRDRDADHCLQLVKANDTDRYLSSLLANHDKQRALFAIYAFDVEISSVWQKVSEPGLGEIRLQWWRDELDAVYGGNCDNHPVAKELQKTVHRFDLPKHLFTHLVDAHRFDIYSEPMANLEDLRAYLAATDTAMANLASRILIGYEALELDYLIGRAGIARGLGKLINQLPVQVKGKRCFLPASLLNNRDATVQEVQAGVASTGVLLVISEICHQITENLNLLRQEQGKLKKDVLPAFFPASLAELVAKNASRTSGNPLLHSSEPSQLKMQLNLFKKSLFEKV